MNRRALLSLPLLAFALRAKQRPFTADLRGELASATFPPLGHAYRDNAPAHRLWRRLLIEQPERLEIIGPDPNGLAAAYRNRVLKAGDRRSPHQLAMQLARQYGQQLDAMVYTTAFGVLGRLRAGETESIQPLLEPFLDGTKDALANVTASHYSGHLLLAAYARVSGDRRALTRVRAAADAALTNPLDDEMSDSIFMVSPLLAVTSQLTGESKYAAAAVHHFQRIEALCLRPDGLYRHSPLCEAAWGRGNAFPLLGLALTLSEISSAPLLSAFSRLAARLAQHQQTDGMWRQVIDVEIAWTEYSATAMIATALRRGMKRGWLPRRYHPNVARAWNGIERRTMLDGTLIDVCESTGKQKSLDDYLNREAILGRDARGGGMALLLSTE